MMTTTTTQMIYIDNVEREWEPQQKRMESEWENALSLQVRERESQELFEK